MSVFATLYAAIIGSGAALAVALLVDACSDPDRPRLLDDKPEHDVPGWTPADVELMRDRERDQVWGRG